MTTRADLPRLAGSLAVLGTLLEDRGQQAWDVLASWTTGPTPPPTTGERGGGTGEAGQEDQAEQRRWEARAARLLAEQRADLTELDRLVQNIIRRIDIACPPNTAEVKNRRTGNLDPVTPAEVAIEGWCASCWRDDQTLEPIEKDRHGLRYYRDYCRWCGAFKAKHDTEPPLALLKRRHAGQRISEDDIRDALKAERRPKSKKKRRKTA